MCIFSAFCLIDLTHFLNAMGNYFFLNKLDFYILLHKICYFYFWKENCKTVLISHKTKLSLLKAADFISLSQYAMVWKKFKTVFFFFTMEGKPWWYWEKINKTNHIRKKITTFSIVTIGIKYLGTIPRVKK